MTVQHREADPAPRERQGPGARIAMATVIILAVVGTAWLFVKMSGLLLLVFAALVLAAILDAITRVICRIPGLPRGLGLALAVVTLLAVITGAFTLFGTQIVGEFDTIRDSIPPAIDQVQALLERFGLGDATRDLIEQGQGDLSNLLSQAGGYALTAGNGIANLVLLFVGAIFIASDPAVYRRGLILLMPQRAESPLGEALDDAVRGLRGWMMGQAVSSVVVAALTWAGLAALGVPAAGGLGIIAGLLDVIPMIGPIIAGVPAVLLAFTVSPMTALWTTLVFLVIQQLQGNFLQPMIQKQAVDVPPAVLLFAVVAAGLLFGFMGMLLAAPLTVVVFVMVQRIYVRTLLGKKIKIAGQD
ncbi:putative PurR-regulated permease PerM [Sphingobium sp. B2D3A]|uniref:AI-2E family transporter n=1 Tax=unclassified Sphingobium TaxID=2611147 RepID=UPI0022246130|nr:MULTISPECIES: AI-2E family transporter [unclassified Sphingobium]MCW2336623.1 putative PurR-regulated permease PerM [Sphingobium sp. B2D3A]MCW2386377.1 putative PurR-regulated permease PerM [Sphingobium sp. B2D3D]